ncbi:MAG: hypothetical protein NTU61_03225, partial [Candidatus Altiarchaeota archaeon]|nr:hypothetical protein [Candidatus Altiarchaeota archaeon]
KPSFEVGLASVNPSNPRKVTEHGTVIRVLDEGVDCKDAVLFPERIGGRVHMLVRLKPGIQVVSFDSMDDVVSLAGDPQRREDYWNRMRADYQRNPSKYNHIHPNTPEMTLMEARWKPLFQERIKALIEMNPDRDYLRGIKDEGYFWYGNGPAPIKTEHGWLTFPHRGQVIAELNEEGESRRKMEGERIDTLKFYCVFAALHDLEDPKRILAVSPTPLTLPDPENPRLLKTFKFKDSVPFVNITAGAVREQKRGEPHILLMVGVNDVYTIPQWFKEKELLDWMLEYGRVR